ncbi:MAG TPA: hypothetical protein ENG98_01220 [Actinobacteria bacterium]|nr:hypothetical protein BMS3Bbin02_00984 [bacterium BMS3Bbin02]HDL41618.1 hypothetical protein [Actinomycetota bacterium]
MEVLGDEVQVVVLSGVPGVGKTTTAEAMSDLLVADDVPHAWLDGDQLTLVYPRDPDDPHAHRLFFENLAQLWASYRAARARRMIIARVVEEADEMDGYRQAIPGAEIVVVELRSPQHIVHQRILRREYAPEWVLRMQNRSDELRPILENNGIADHVVLLEHETPEQVAKTVLKRIGWTA